MGAFEGLFRFDCTRSAHRLLRGKTVVRENPAYSRGCLDPDKRSIANAVQNRFRDGTHSPKVLGEYPLGYHRRRQEAKVLLWEKFEKNLAAW